MRTIDVGNEMGVQIVNKYKSYLQPKEIYLPLSNKSHLLFALPHKVLIGSKITQEDSITSTVSGIASKIVAIDHRYYLLVENDYKEDKEVNKRVNPSKMSKEVFLDKLPKSISSLLQNVKETLYINAIENEPCFFNKYMFLKRDIKELIKNIILVKNILSIENVIILIKENYKDVMTYEIKSELEFYNIEFKLLPNIYPLGNNILLSKYLNINKEEQIIDLWDFISCYYIAFKNRENTTKYITVYDSLNSFVLQTKKGTLLEEILNNYKLDDNNWLINNSLVVKNYKIKKQVISDHFNGLIKYSNRITLPCSNCGLCALYCPSKINPLIKNHKCIHCGLCNFICPSNIDIIDIQGGLNENKKN